MKKQLLFALSAMLLCVSMQTQAQKWTNLFDGKTFKGFKQLGGKAIYEVKDGVMVGTTVPNTGNSFMATEDEYGDCVTATFIQQFLLIQSKSVGQYGDLISRLNQNPTDVFQFDHFMKKQ